jgi:hypothetical protein
MKYQPKRHRKSFTGNKPMVTPQINETMDSAFRLMQDDQMHGGGKMGPFKILIGMISMMSAPLDVAAKIELSEQVRKLSDDIKPQPIKCVYSDARG